MPFAQAHVQNLGVCLAKTLNVILLKKMKKKTWEVLVKFKLLKNLDQLA